MKKSHASIRRHLAVFIVISALVTVFSLSACSKKASEPEVSPSEVAEKSADGDKPSTDTADKDAKPENKAEPAQAGGEPSKAEGEPAKGDADLPEPQAEENKAAPAKEVYDYKRAMEDWNVSPQPPIAKSVAEEFEFPKCMICHYCKDNEEEGELSWASGSECRLSAAQIDKIIQLGAVNQWNEYGQTPLMLANDLKSVEKLLAAGADPKHSDEFGNTAMNYARTEQIQKALIKAGYEADPETEYVLFEPTPYKGIDEDIGSKMSDAKKRASKPAEAIAEDMFDRDTSWSDGDDAFGHCYRDDRIIRGWIGKGNDVNAKDENGRTPLFYVNYPKEARILIAAGANVNAQDNDGNTPLMWFIRMESFENGFSTDGIIETLIAAGADTTITNKEGKTAKSLKGL